MQSKTDLISSYHIIMFKCSLHTNQKIKIRNHTHTHNILRKRGLFRGKKKKKNKSKEAISEKDVLADTQVRHEKVSKSSMG